MDNRLKRQIAERISELFGWLKRRVGELPAEWHDKKWTVRAGGKPGYIGWDARKKVLTVGVKRDRKKPPGGSGGGGGEPNTDEASGSA